MMDASFIEKILEIGEPQTITINGQEYSKQKLYPVLRPTVTNEAVVEVTTLQAVVDFFESGDVQLDDVIVTVLEHNHVRITSKLHGVQRNLYLVAQFEEHTYGGYEKNGFQWYQTQDFIIALNTDFAPSSERNELLQLISSVVAEDKLMQEDDGVSQTVTVRKGVAFVGTKKLPNPVTLYPYKTFQEIEPVPVQYLLRANDGPRWVLIEADGGKWKYEAKRRVAEWLKANLPNGVLVLW